MSYYKCYVAKDLSEYINIITEIKKNDSSIEGDFWYRGQECNSYKLIPTGLRNLVPLKNGCGLSVDRKYLREGDEVGGIRIEKMFFEFKRRAIKFIDYTPNNNFEWMFIAQHYGLPTRLLDWTTNPLVALYFAMPKNLEYEEQNTEEEDIEEFLQDGYGNNGAAVFVIDPCNINKETCSIREPIDISSNSEEWDHYLDPTEKESLNHFPICVFSSHIDKRIISQSGNFTLHGSFTKPLDTYEPFRDKIYKIFIPYKRVHTILFELKSIGITESFIYQDLQSLSKEIAYEEDIKFKKNLNNRKNK